MRRISISELKTHAFEVIDQVARNREPVIVTKRGKPLAELIPTNGLDEIQVPGRLSEALVFEKDIVSPIGESAQGIRQ